MMPTYVTACAICGEETEDILSGLCDNCSAALAGYQDSVYEALMAAHAFRHKKVGFAVLNAALDNLGITITERGGNDG